MSAHRETAARIADSAHVVDWIEDALRDLKQFEGQRAALQLLAAKLKEVVRTLVKFAVHDESCARVQGEKNPGLVHPDLAKHCTCGLERLYSQIDALITD